VHFNYLIKLVIFLMGSVLFAIPMAGAGDMADVNVLMEQSQNQQITVPKIKGNKNAEESAKTFHSSEYQKRLNRQIETLRSRMHEGSANSDPPKISRKEKNQNAFLMPDERIYLFVSSSMPISTLKNYASDLDKLNDPNIIMVMRGFVGGLRFIKPTLVFIDSILIKDPNCDPKRKKCDAYQASINIDPALFMTYGVQAVPAIVYARGVNETEMEEGQGTTDAATLDAFMVTGDVTFDYALEMITKESKSSQTENILKKLRRGFY